MYNFKGQNKKKNISLISPSEIYLNTHPVRIRESENIRDGNILSRKYNIINDSICKLKRTGI
jgi:hypothetical protein